MKVVVEKYSNKEHWIRFVAENDFDRLVLRGLYSGELNGNKTYCSEGMCISLENSSMPALVIEGLAECATRCKLFENKSCAVVLSLDEYLEQIVEIMRKCVGEMTELAKGVKFG